MSNDKAEKKCQECGKRKPTIYMTDFVDGKPVKKHICQQCYDAVEGAPPLSSSELFAKLVDILAPELRKAGRRKCPECGLDYVEFRQSFEFGCAKDYEIFSKALDDLFQDIHGANRHVGKIPEGRAQTLFGGTQRLRVLQREIKKAVEKEDFERAAHLKTKIEQMEQTSVGDIIKE